MSGGTVVDMIPVALSIGAYLALNSSLNMLNRWLLGIYGFSFPFSLTVMHAVFSFVALTPLMLTVKYRRLHAESLRKQWVGIVSIGLFMAANISLNNLSLVFITLSLNQIIRASIPVVTAIMAYFVEKKTSTPFELGALSMLCTGVMVCAYNGSAAGNAVGIAFCMLATVSNAAMMTFSGKILSEKMDALRLTWYTAPVTAIAVLPLLLRQEAGRLAVYVGEQDNKLVEVLLLNAAGCVNALAYNVIHVVVIHLTSAVTTTVLGMVKIVGLLVLSSIFLGEAGMFDLKMTAGAALAVAGFCSYSWARLQRAAAAAGDAAVRATEKSARLLEEEEGKGGSR